MIFAKNVKLCFFFSPGWYFVQGISKIQICFMRWFLWNAKTCGGGHLWGKITTSNSYTTCSIDDFIHSKYWYTSLDNFFQTLQAQAQKPIRRQNVTHWDEALELLFILNLFMYIFYIIILYYCNAFKTFFLQALTF